MGKVRVINVSKYVLKLNLKHIKNQRKNKVIIKGKGEE